MGNLDNVDFPPESQSMGLSRDTIERARRLVASNARDADDCNLLLRVLGIHPSQGDELTELAIDPAPAQDTPSSTPGRKLSTMFR